MAKGVPTNYTRWLERFLRDHFEMSETKPEFARELSPPYMLPNDYMVKLIHPRAKLQWAFRQNKITKNPGSKTFNVEVTPPANHTISSSVVEKAWRNSGLPGEVGFNGREFFFQFVWGRGNETYRLIQDERLASLPQWGIDAMQVAIRLVEGQEAKTSVSVTGHNNHDSELHPPNGLRPVERRLELETENLLEDLIIQDWKDLNFGADLDFIKRQVRCGNIGTIDILARNRTNNNYAVIELKKQKAEDEAFGQLSRYMGWVQNNMAASEQVGVEGMIIASEITSKLKAAVASNPRVRALRYNISISLQSDGET